LKSDKMASIIELNAKPFISHILNLYVKLVDFFELT